jgi:hypothetical protein
MALDADPRDTLESWWAGLSPDDQALVERHTKIPSDSEQLREVVLLSGLPMVPAAEWSARAPLYRLPDQIGEYLAGRTPVVQGGRRSTS